MRITTYRLGERRIVQAGDGLWWEAHAGIGALQSGRCIVRGSLLFLFPSEREEPGYLKREFLESLHGLAEWDRTKYYCSNYSIHDCRSGRRLTDKEFFEWPRYRAVSIDHCDSWASVSRGNPHSLDARSFKLGQHEIIQRNGQWWWNTCSVSGTLREGRCAVEGEILFFGVCERAESGGLKESFLERFRHLPQWNSTNLFCPSCAIYDCRTGENLIGLEEDMHLAGPAVIPDGGVPIPFAKTASPLPLAMHSPPSAPFRTPRRSSCVDSTLSLLEGLAGKAFAEIHRMKEGVLKWRMRRKKRSLEMQNHRFHVKKWIAWGGVVILMVRFLLLFLHRLWECAGHHPEHHEHSADRHRRN
ncbi:MAG: hypothetical protein C4576_00090 [Desulfobacteraceae bacterium]|nr:MAG: hypothetical protein C4576_00090 [Desulfobacteraceae bacterium]